MNENIKKLLEAAKNDESLKEKLTDAKNVGEAVALAKAAGFDITEDEANELAAQKKSGELSDEELENVAGGGCLGKPRDEPWWNGLN